MSSKLSADRPGVLFWPPLALVLAMAVAWAVHVVAPLKLGWRPASTIAGAVTIVLAGAVAAAAGRVMKAAGTNIRPDRPSLVLVRLGPYRFTRNPMYVSLCLLQIGAGFLWDDALALSLMLPLGVALHYGVVLREEHYLERKFGPVYRDYCQSVRRWM